MRILYQQERIVKMAVRDILYYGDPILREECKNVSPDEDLSDLIADMMDTMYEAEGIGLAANQIGVKKNIFVVENEVEAAFFANKFPGSIFQELLEFVDFKDFENSPVIIKGCSEKPIPKSAFSFLISKLQPITSSILFGEACSTVPLYKSKK